MVYQTKIEENPSNTCQHKSITLYTIFTSTSPSFNLNM